MPSRKTAMTRTPNATELGCGSGGQRCWSAMHVANWHDMWASMSLIQPSHSERWYRPIAIWTRRWMKLDTTRTPSFAWKRWRLRMFVFPRDPRRWAPISVSWRRCRVKCHIPTARNGPPSAPMMITGRVISRNQVSLSVVKHIPNMATPSILFEASPREHKSTAVGHTVQW